MFSNVSSALKNEDGFWEARARCAHCREIGHFGVGKPKSRFSPTREIAGSLYRTGLTNESFTNLYEAYRRQILGGLKIHPKSVPQNNDFCDSKNHHNFATIDPILKNFDVPEISDKILLSFDTSMR